VPFQQAIVQSAITRAQPIVLTGLAAMLGAFFILDDPIFNGLAISLIFGIAVSTVLTLVVIPILYFMAYRRRVDVVRGGRRMMTMKYVAASALLVGVMAGFNAKATDLLQAWQAAEHERELAVARAAHAAADPLRRQADALWRPGVGVTAAAGWGPWRERDARRAVLRPRHGHEQRRGLRHLGHQRERPRASPCRPASRSTTSSAGLSSSN
jgi:hypothetical protein